MPLNKGGKLARSQGDQNNYKLWLNFITLLFAFKVFYFTIQMLSLDNSHLAGNEGKDLT